ncbi:MAG: hemerythrin family protein [Magnetococcales bacterium]|nr:hemerythrin family protein [Magnetococcales bacterium]
MPSISGWDLSWNTGVQDIDAEHQKLYELIKTFSAAWSDGFGSSAIGGTLDDLIEYTLEHFENEEKQLKQMGYGLLEEHKKIHQNLVSQVLTYRDKLTEVDDRESLGIEVGALLQNWLIQHIVNMDVPAFNK